MQGVLKNPDKMRAIVIGVLKCGNSNKMDIDKSEIAHTTILKFLFDHFFEANMDFQVKCKFLFIFHFLLCNFFNSGS